MPTKVTIRVLDDDGSEIPDPTPVSLPVGFKRPPTLDETIRRLVREQISSAASDAGYESLEESDDFDIPDDPAMPASEHELDGDQLSRSLEPLGRSFLLKDAKIKGYKPPRQRKKAVTVKDTEEEVPDGK